MDFDSNQNSSYDQRSSNNQSMKRTSKYVDLQNQQMLGYKKQLQSGGISNNEFNRFCDGNRSEANLKVKVWSV